MYKKTYKKRTKNTILVKFVEQIAHFLWAKEQMSDLLILSFIMNDLTKWAMSEWAMSDEQMRIPNPD